MKSLIATLVLAISVIILSCTSQQYAPTVDEEMYGTWENEDYSAHTAEFWSESQQVVMKSGGEGQMGRLLERADVGTKMDIVYTITSKRTDTEGNVWYEQIWTAYFEYGGKLQEHSRFYVLSKVSDSGKTLELIRDETGYPAEMDPEKPGYRIFYRKK